MGWCGPRSSRSGCLGRRDGGDAGPEEPGEEEESDDGGGEDARDGEDASVETEEGGFDEGDCEGPEDFEGVEDLVLSYK